MYRTLIVLGLAQCFGQTAQPVMVLLGGIVGASMAPSMALATLPVALMIVGTACMVIPASLLMARIGRRAGFLIATGGAILAGLLAAWAINLGQFWLFCLAAFMVGCYGAFMQQFRFAVAESVPEDKAGKCVSLLMLAGIVAAFLGPEVASRLSALPGQITHAGSFFWSERPYGLFFLLPVMLPQYLLAG